MKQTVSVLQQIATKLTSMDIRELMTSSDMRLRATVTGYSDKM